MVKPILAQINWQLHLELFKWNLRRESCYLEDSRYIFGFGANDVTLRDRPDVEHFAESLRWCISAYLTEDLIL